MFFFSCFYDLHRDLFNFLQLISISTLFKHKLPSLGLGKPKSWLIYWKLYTLNWDYYEESEKMPPYKINIPIRKRNFERSIIYKCLKVQEN